jgi:hypothetical protein
MHSACHYCSITTLSTTWSTALLTLLLQYCTTLSLDANTMSLLCNRCLSLPYSSQAVTTAAAMHTTAIVTAVVVSAASPLQATVTTTLTTTQLTTTAVAMAHSTHSQHTLQGNKLHAQVSALQCYIHV